jgi:hypothetical protein
MPVTRLIGGTRYYPAVTKYSHARDLGARSEETISRQHREATAGWLWKLDIFLRTIVIEARSRLREFSLIRPLAEGNVPCRMGIGKSRGCSQ